MGEKTKIEWTHHTFNPWWGCTRVSPACDHCYAETFAKRTGHTIWGNENRRRFFGQKHWEEPIKWNDQATKASERRRVFCASMADVFELLPRSHPDWEQMHAARQELWQLIYCTPALDWLLLTKRPQNVMRLVSEAWQDRLPDNVWIGTTAEDQKWYDQRWSFLRKIPARVRFFSIEPMLARVNLYQGEREQPSWIICGGESGPGSRPMHPDWPRLLRNDCIAAGVPFHFKQWGNLLPACQAAESQERNAKHFPSPHNLAKMNTYYDIGKKAAGRLLDGREWNEYPEVVNV